MRVASLARQRRWREAYATMLNPTRYARPVVWIGSLLAGVFGAPEDPSDLVVTVEAEDKFSFKERLAQIAAPTLVVAGEKTPITPWHYSARRPQTFQMPGSSCIWARVTRPEGSSSNETFSLF